MAYQDSSRNSAKLYQRARCVLPGGNSRHTVFHPPYPLYARRGEGCRVTDADGNERIDFANNYTTLIHGHRHPAIIAAVREQLDRITTVAMPTESEIELAETLCGRLSGVDQIRFANSGTEAVMAAIRGARAHTGRYKIAKVEGCYHGGYDFAEVSECPPAAAWGDSRKPDSVATCAATPQGVLDDVIVLPWNDADATRGLIRRNAADLAAVLIDPVPMRMGFCRGEDRYLREIRDLTAEWGIVLIFDEVLCFRLGYRGAQGYLDITPDMTVLGKLIGGGFPVGAVGGKRQFMSVFDPTIGARAPHSGTFFANPVTMAAGKACMEMLTPDAYERIGALGERLTRGLHEALSITNVDGQVVGLESMRGLLLDSTPIHNYRDFAGLDGLLKKQFRLFMALIDRGVMPTMHGMFFISTAMDNTVIDFTVEQVIDALRETR